MAASTGAFGTRSFMSSASPRPTCPRITLSGRAGRPYSCRTWLVLATIAAKLSISVPSKSNRTARRRMVVSRARVGLSYGVLASRRPRGAPMTPPSHKAEPTHHPPAEGDAQLVSPTPEHVFREYAPRIYNLAKRMLGNNADA